ncbi:hypothetical protein D2E64_21730 [Mycobacteroides abscessus]|nr:hypothetical protein DDJ61_10975 [Mycobacteroides abscessus]PVA76850.1 hypothetical protein DDJ76_18835 [Mycobacteroides abscessus]RIR95625.1 hypothetical protein D2E50_03085 [Mycobacteroides abscessus]RIS15605.1 hypothetical protein D2E63_01070 [Mycobacteroides abscessus]RIS23093.1 hypothetical protein D2E69_01750 [Mycobacteroides abscessus]
MCAVTNVLDRKSGYGGAMSLLLTLAVLLVLGGAMYGVYRGRSSWGPALGGLATGDPDSLNPRLQAERAVPRPPWPIDEDGNPIERNERG